MAEEERASAFGLWRYAREYLAAARTLADAAVGLHTIVVHTDITYQCACQGLELAFKAYLGARGATLGDLRGIGHPITKAMTAALDRGLEPISLDHARAIATVDQLYAAHEFRYIVTGAKVYPALQVLLAAGAAVLSTIAPTVSVAATGDETLVLRMRQKAAQITAARSS